MEKPGPSDQVDMQAAKAKLKLIDDLPTNTWLADKRYELLFEHQFDPSQRPTDLADLEKEFGIYNSRVIAGKQAKAELEAEIEALITNSSPPPISD